MRQQARLLVDGPAAGSWNMAVDQTLLEGGEDAGEMTLRFYRWDQPTLSLGYFQRLQDRETHRPSLPCPVVRRSTGGGAILHDDEVTYSLCVPSENRWSKHHERLYWIIHQSIIQVLADNGVQAESFRDAGDRTAQSDAAGGQNKSDLRAIDGHQPGSVTVTDHAAFNSHEFLCFRRRNPGDIVCGDHKICGSAQRRKRKAILQHGSVLLRKSKFAPELLGIEDVVNGWLLNHSDFVLQSSRLVSERLNVELIESQLRRSEIERARQTEEVFLSATWHEKTAHPRSFTK